MRFLLPFALLVLTAGQAAQAQMLPNLAIAEKQLGDARKYWLLHKAGVSQAEAEADFAFCWRFLDRGVQRSVPDFVPWRQPDAKRQQAYSLSQYGLVGDVIAAIIAGPIERSIKSARLFRCMVPRGYARYRTSEDLWKQLMEQPPAQAIPVLARIASGPVPPTEKVLP